MENFHKDGNRMVRLSNEKDQDSLVFFRYRGNYLKKIFVSPVNRSFSRPNCKKFKPVFKFTSITPTDRKVKSKRVAEEFQDKNLQAVYEKLVQQFKS